MIASLSLALVTVLISSLASASSHSLSQGSADAVIVKPTVQPPAVNLDEYIQLLSFPYEVTPWNNGKINYECKKIFTREGYDVKDIEMLHVSCADVCKLLGEINLLHLTSV